jgi:hypothetical protein
MAEAAIAAIKAGGSLVRVFAQLLNTETIPNAAKELDLCSEGLGDTKVEFLGDDDVVKIADVLKVRRVL